jgi:uncharacterized SAM-binding protein YcdF (DUF218 family)
MTYIQPLFPLLLAAALIGALTYKRASNPRLLIGSLIGLFLISWPPIASLVLQPYESPFSHQPPADRSVQAIVVLSSAVFPPDPPLPAAVLAADTYERCVYGAWLYKNWLSVPILVSGGGFGGTPYSLTMGDALRWQGVPESMLWTEQRSRSTYENAAYSAEILRRKGIRKIALVTEAYHMTRAAKCFRKQGIEVIPAACGFRGSFPAHLQQLIPTWEAVSWNEDIFHESVGLLWYRFQGRI